MSLPVCLGCGRLGVSLGDERFCANCLYTMNAQAEVGIDFLLDWLSKYDAFETYYRATRGVAA